MITFDNTAEPTRSPEELVHALVQAADGEPEWVQQLLMAGAHPTGMPMLMAIQCGQAEIVQMMIAAGADVNAPFHHTTPLIHAITSSYPDIVGLFIRAGADVNQVAPDGMVPLAAARAHGRTNVTNAIQQRILRLLIEAGAQD
jgi:hypothetical protein